MARKSLGTLTLDLIAKVSGFEQGMDKASRKSQKTAKRIEKHAKQIGTAIAAGSAAAVTGMAALVASTAEGAREIRNMADLSNATTQQFQRGAYAVQRYGIETDKYADILKDVNDRVGDFIQTGGGPMADFFEKIAPKVGVTADEFARLSGPEALQLYVDSLEAAGASQQEMTFYMEAIASDATALIPLLRDGGKEMKTLGDEAERTGNVFSEVEFEQLEDIRRGFDELSGAATGMKNEIALAALPAVNDLIDLLSDESTLDSARALGEAIVTSMNFVIEAIDGAVKVTQFLAEEMAAFVHGPAFDDIPRLTDKLDDLNEALEEQEKRLSNLRQTPNLVPKEVLANEEERLRLIKEEQEATLKLIESARDAQSAELGAGTGVGTVDVPPGGDSGGGNSGGSNIGAGTGLSHSDQELQKELQDRLSTIRQAFENEKQEILRTFKERNEEINELEQEAVLSSMEATHLRYQNEQRSSDQLKELREQQLADQKGYWEEWLESANENLQNFDELSKTVIDNFTTGFGNAFESVIFDSQTLDDALKGIGETILRSVVNAIGQMAAQWLALQAVQAVVGSSATAATVAQAGIASAAWAPAAAMASLATMGGNAVPAATALTTTTTLASGLAIAGMAHDGIDSIPSEGTWLLDKDERVLSSPQADKLDAFLASQQGGGGSSNISVNLHEDASKAGQVEQRQRPDGGTDVNVFVSDIMSNGPRSKALESAYGLRRQGR